MTRSLTMLAILSMAACTAAPESSLPTAASSQSDRAGGPTHSWMSPKAKSSTLVYVADYNTVDVYSYPAGGLVGQLTLHDVSTMCSDSAGNVWMADFQMNGAQMVEYAHGATQPTQSLFTYLGGGCAIDPKTGDLAVVGGNAEGHRNLEIYENAQGLPKTMTSPYFTEWWACAYDNKSNLLIQGTVKSFGESGLGELLKGHKKITAVNIKTDYFSGGVQWDGKYFVVAYYNDYQLWRYSIKKGNATFIDNINLPIQQDYWFQNFWLAGKMIFASSVTEADVTGGPIVAAYPYPAGSPQRFAVSPGVYPLAMTVSVAPKP